MSVLTVHKFPYGPCHKCRDAAIFYVIRNGERSALTHLCRKCCQEFVKYFRGGVIGDSEILDQCETCGQTMPEPEKAKRNTVSSCQRCGTGYEVLVTGSIVYCGKCEEGTEYD